MRCRRLKRFRDRFSYLLDEKKWDERVSYSAELTIDFGEVKPLQTIKLHDLAAWARLAYASVKTQPHVI